MSEKKVIVTVNEGKIRGIQKKSNFSGVEYYSFFGVPYGQPTGGSARFKDPVKVKPWKTILDATSEKKEGCAQLSVRLGKLAGSEDCLYNNIHTPNLPTKSDTFKPVVVCIHPGGGFHGSPETWYYGSPDYVMHRDIVYVCVGYRLHILGLLNLGLKECAGNQQLKDIILSLHWIKRNISAFGGDPNNITLLGSSSGSYLAHILMLSPAAKGLFHKAVIMGLHAFNPALTVKKDHKEEAYQVASDVLKYEKKDKKDEKQVLSCLKTEFLDAILQYRPELMCSEQVALLFPCTPFAPTVDKGVNAVLPESPEKLIDCTARIPLMFGMCDKETAMGFTRPYKKGTMAKFYESYRQNCAGWGRDITDNEVKLIKKQIDSYYLNGSSIETAPLSVKVDIQTDISYSSVYNTLIDVIAKDLPSSVFVYKFEFDGNVCSMKDKIVQLLDEPLEGNCHAADFCYWACIKDHWGVRTPSLSPKSREIVETFTKLISTFARTGNPNYEGLHVEWNPTTPENPCHLNINDTLSMVNGKLNGEKMKFWEDIQKQFKKN